MSRIPLKEQAKDKYFKLKARLELSNLQDDDVKSKLLRKLYYYLGQWRTLNVMFVKEKIYRKNFYEKHKLRMVKYQKEYGLKRRAKK